MVTVALMAFSLGSLFFGFAQGFAFIRATRENVRATQILQERMETIRLYTWDQLTNGTAPVTFTNYQYASGPASANQGIAYIGTQTITKAPITESYGGDLLQVSVKLTWASGAAPHKKQATTLVSRYGIQNYVYR
jgi:hypothetical protein